MVNNFEYNETKEIPLNEPVNWFVKNISYNYLHAFIIKHCIVIKTGEPPSYTQKSRASMQSMPLQKPQQKLIAPFNQ